MSYRSRFVDVASVNPGESHTQWTSCPVLPRRGRPYWQIVSSIGTHTVVVNPTRAIGSAYCVTGVCHRSHRDMVAKLGRNTVALRRIANRD